MWKNYLVIALRGLWIGRFYTIITIAGLASGLAACLLIFAHIRYELAYDHWVPAGERIFNYEVQVQFLAEGGVTYYFTTSPYGAIEDIPQALPKVEAATAIAEQEIHLLKEETPLDLTILGASPDFFEFFPLEPRLGDPAAALAEPGSLVLTTEAARRLLGEDASLGQVVRSMSGENYKLAAIVEPIPDQTHFEFDALVPLPVPAEEDIWGWDGSRTVYFRLVPGTGIEEVRVGIETLTKSRIAPPGYTGEPEENPVEVKLCALQSLHFEGGRCASYFKPNVSRDALAALARIGGIILLLGTVNFANIELARSLRRAREVGLRKLVGASRSMVAVQFLGESMLVALFALIAGAVLAELAAPFFSELVGREGELPLFQDGLTIAGMLGLGLLAGVAGGIWPAFVGARYRPADIFGAGLRRAGKQHVRTALVVGQFAVAIGLGITAAVTASQFRFARESHLGFDSRDVVLLQAGFEHKQSMPVLAGRLKSETAIESVALGYGGPLNGGVSITNVAREPSGETTAMKTARADAAFFHVLRIGVERPAGSPPLDRIWRPGTVMINEAARERLGFASDKEAVGSNLYAALDEGEEPRALEIVGIVEDIYELGLSAPPQPTLFRPYEQDDPPWVLLARLRPGQESRALAAIDRAWRDVFPQRPVNRIFAEQQVLSRFDQIQRRMQTYTSAAGLAIVIAALGLFGLAARAAETRTREIATRKVLGAKLRDVLRLLLWQFTKPILLANIIAWPVAAWYLHDWLQGFILRIDLTLWPFLLVGAAALAIALVTVAGHAIRVARTHPAMALREE